MGSESAGWERRVLVFIIRQPERHDVHVIMMVSHHKATQTGARSIGFKFRVLAGLSA